MDQQKWREWRYQYDLGAKGSTTGSAASHQGFREVYQSAVERQQRYDAAIRSSFGTGNSTAANAGWSAPPGPAPSFPLGGAAPYSSGTGPISIDVPAPGIIIAIRILLTLIVLGGVDGGAWAWVTDDPHPIATGFSSAWLVVRVYLSIVLFALSQLVLVGIEVCVVLWPFVKELILRMDELSLPWAAAAGIAAFAGFLALIWGIRKLLSFVRLGFRFLTLLAVALAGLAIFVPSWWSAHVTATQSIIYWSDANISWLVVTREVLGYLTAG